MRMMKITTIGRDTTRHENWAGKEEYVISPGLTLPWQWLLAVWPMFFIQVELGLFRFISRLLIFSTSAVSIPRIRDHWSGNLATQFGSLLSHMDLIGNSILQLPMHLQILFLASNRIIIRPSFSCFSGDNTPQHCSIQLGSYRALAYWYRKYPLLDHGSHGGGIFCGYIHYTVRFNFALATCELPLYWQILVGRHRPSRSRKWHLYGFSRLTLCYLSVHWPVPSVAS